MRPLERIVEVEGKAVSSWQDVRMALITRAMNSDNTTVITQSGENRHRYVLVFSQLNKDDINADIM